MERFLGFAVWIPFVVAPELVRASAPPRDEAVVHLSLPGGFTTAPAAGTARRAEIVVAGSYPIELVELWYGSRRVARKRLPEAPTSWRGELDWVPEASSETLLVARAIDDRGHTVQSNVLHLRGRGDALRLGTARRPVSGRESLAAVAVSEGVDPDTLALLNPELSVDEVLPEGLEVIVPLVADLPETNPGPPSIAALALGPRPGIVVASLRCEAWVLGWARGRRPLVLYRLSPNDTTFELVATEATGAHLFEQPLGPGTHAFVVGAYDDVLSLSPPIVLEAGESSDWSTNTFKSPLQLPPSYDLLRAASLPVYADRNTRVPTKLKTVYVPDGRYFGPAFQGENRLLPDPGPVGPVSVTETYYLHRSIDKAPIQGYLYFPQGNSAAVEKVPYESLVLHQPFVFEAGAKITVGAFSVCGGFDVATGGL